MRQCLGHRRAFSCAGCRAQPSRGTALRCTAQARKRDANRRELIALGLLASQATQQPAWADEGAGASGTQRCYMDMAVDGQAQGRIVIELDDISTVGAQRFSDLCKGIEGVGYRRSKIDAIFPGKFLHCAGVQNLSYGDGGCPIAGDGVAVLQIRPDIESTKLKAIKGKLVNVLERSGVAPNGTEFAITTGGAPELDDTNLIVGRVVEGMDVVSSLSKLPVVKNNSSSPFFQAGKLVGDKRAIVAEMGFDRPFNKVLVAASGLL